METQNAPRTDRLGPDASAFAGPLSRGVGLLALSVLLLEVWRPLQISDLAITALALFTLLATVLQIVMRPGPAAAALFPFLPALPIGAWIQISGNSSQGARAMAAVAFGFEARRQLLAIAEERQRARGAIAASLEAKRPSRATVFVDNDIVSEVETAALRPGHIFRLGPGEVSPADGLVTFGSGFVDDNLLEEGAEDLQLKGMGSLLYAGSRNKNAALLVRAGAVGDQTFSSRLAARIREGSELPVAILFAADAALAALGGAAYFWLGPGAALRFFLITSGAGCFALVNHFELGLARTSALRRWLWGGHGLGHVSRAGMLVLPPEGVVFEGRPRLAAVECSEIAGFSEDAALGMLGALARKLESPVAFALLQELRLRNIPLQQSEFFEAEKEGGFAIVNGEDIRWLNVNSVRAGSLPLDDLAPFVHEHINAGDDVVLMERQGHWQAAFAFRDVPVKDVAAAADALRLNSLPVLLVCSLPRPAAARLQTELGLDHAHGEAGGLETEILLDRLTEQNLKPAWVRTGTYLPRRACASVSLPFFPEAADLIAPRLDLPSLALALVFARRAYSRLRTGLLCLYGVQAALLLSLVLGQARGWAPYEAWLGVLAVAPGFLSLLAAPLGD